MSEVVDDVTLESGDEVNYGDLTTITSGVADFDHAVAPHIHFRPFAIEVVASGKVVGGLLATFHGEFAEIKRLWLPGELRGHGYGRMVMAMTEACAASWGATTITVEVMSYLSTDFFAHLGYAPLGRLAGFANGATCTYVSKGLDPTAADPTLLVETLSVPPVTFMRSSLPGIAASMVLNPAVERLTVEAGFGKAERLFIVARSSEGKVVGGLMGATQVGALHVDDLWVAAGRRRGGLGRRLMEAAEREAVGRSCELAWLETTSYQARPFYEALGYKVWYTTNITPKVQRHGLTRSLVGGDRPTQQNDIPA